MKAVVFAVLPECILLDIAEAAEAFRIANRVTPRSYALKFVGPRPQLRSGVGLQLQGLGALLAARAGLLRAVECTTHHAHIDELKALDPQAIVHADRVFVEDGRIYTSAGVTAGLDLALHLIGRDLGHRVAAAVARELVVYRRRSGSDPALSPWVLYRNHLHPAVHRVQEAVSKEPAQDWSAPRLAEFACMSSRNLARLFAEHAGCSPLDYVQRMRIALARELVQQTHLDLERVADRSGFRSAHQLRRAWRRWESGTPTDHRNST